MLTFAYFFINLLQIRAPRVRRIALNVAASVAVFAVLASGAQAQSSAAPAEAHGNGPSGQAATALTNHTGGKANLVLPDLSRVEFLNGTIDGHTLLLLGLVVCALGLLFGLVIYKQLKNLPVHKSMREISELIYSTCKTYLVTQGKFILILEAFIAVIIVLYFGFLSPPANAATSTGLRVLVILLFSLIGIGGSYGVAWFGIRVNTFANSRTAFASLGGKPYPIYAIPLRAGMSIGMMLISVELLIMLCILLFIPADYAGPC
ncbi:MAG: sodium/proton-translocating pyrophosphatase, partial [Acidobacteria bacterium]|nr:sodium/proton-translocating pyrophosphatase [Acidobacteriota bacterium]